MAAVAVVVAAMMMATRLFDELDAPVAAVRQELSAAGWGREFPSVGPGLPVRSPFRARLVRPAATDVHGGGVDHVFDVRRVIFFDHFDAGAAVFGDSVNVGTFHQA